MGSVRVTGAREIERALLELGRKEARKIGRAALRKAARPILEAARVAVPVREGVLKKHLQVYFPNPFRRGEGDDTIIAEVRVRPGPYRPAKTERARYSYQIGSRPDVYAKFVEFGTGDTAPQPFLRSAWDSDGGTVALGRLGKELGSGIEAAASRLKG